jgi:hypothetical protein
LVDAAPDELSRRTVLTYEEKGTDVNLATRLLLDGFNRRYESAAVISNDGDLKMPIRVVRDELGLHVTVVNPVLHSKHRSAALSPDPLPANASFIRLSGGSLLKRSLLLNRTNGDGGHENLPIGGHRISPLAVTKPPQWRPSVLPIDD